MTESRPGGGTEPQSPDALARIRGTVRVVGAGLLGTSIGLGLRAKGVDVVLDDASPSTLELAIDYGAGRRPATSDRPVIVVVCVPPDITADIVQRELEAFPEALVTDVASVKGEPFARLVERGADLSRYLGSHPMAGRERGGAISGRGDLFAGRPWVISEHGGISFERGAVLEDLILDLGATPVIMTADKHDASVALTSHVPQLISSLLAARLNDADADRLALTGQGVRDVTRIAASAPELWVQILGHNADAIVPILRAYRDDLDTLIGALADPTAPGARRAVAELMAAGNQGVAKLPGKHGGGHQLFTTVIVQVKDQPGELGRLLVEIGEAGINMEDLRLEHSPGTLVGLAEISVVPERRQELVDELTRRGWKVSAV